MFTLLAAPCEFPHFKTRHGVKDFLLKRSIEILAAGAGHTLYQKEEAPH